MTICEDHKVLRSQIFKNVSSPPLFLVLALKIPDRAAVLQIKKSYFEPYIWCSAYNDDYTQLFTTQHILYVVKKKPSFFIICIVFLLFLVAAYVVAWVWWCVRYPTTPRHDPPYRCNRRRPLLVRKISKFPLFLYNPSILCATLPLCQTQKTHKTPYLSYRSN